MGRAFSPGMKAHVLLAALSLGAVLAQAQQEIITLWATNAPVPVPTVLSVPEGRTAELLSQPGNENSPSARFIIRRGDKVLFWQPKPTHVEPFRIAGPVEIEMQAYGADLVFATWRMSPSTEITPPDKTAVVPAGTGANIILEKSTDLSNWEPAEPGPYIAPGPSHLFFRLRAERTQE